MNPWLKEVPWYLRPRLPVLLVQALVEHWREERRLRAREISDDHLTLRHDPPRRRSR